MVIDQITWKGSTNDGRRLIYLRKNVDGTNGIFAGQNAARDQNNTFFQNASMVLDLVDGDYIELMVDQQTGSNLDVRAISGLSPHLTFIQVAQ